MDLRGSSRHQQASHGDLHWRRDRYYYGLPDVCSIRDLDIVWKFDVVIHIHILGVCGTFMGGIAKLAVELGFRVSGCDANVYPPMSQQLEQLGIELETGYLPEHLDDLKPDLCIIGNALSRGNPMVEMILNEGMPFQSGAQWLAENVLKDQSVLAVARTHGKTTTASLLTWILDQSGLNPGFLIGGVPENFGESARLGGGKYFVVEADEYDTAFFR